MDIAGLLINVVSGAVGGNLAGVAWKEKSLGTLGNTIAGIVGGAVGVYVLQAVNILGTLGMADMTVGAILGAAGASAFCGAVLTGIVGMIKGAIKK